MRGKYKNNYYCRRDGWIKKDLSIIVKLPSGMIVRVCPFCRRPLRISPRSSKFKSKYSSPRQVELGE